MTAADALRDWGVNVVEIAGWQTRGWLSGYGGTWDPQGVVAHHTANAGYRGVDAPSLNLCINGRPPSKNEPSGLAGPLCQIVLGYSGTANLIAGRGANHAGKGGWNGLWGNASVWGIEAENNGVGEEWPDVQVEAFHRCCAALADFSNFGPENVCGHKEWTDQKIDPAGLDMGEFRLAVARLLHPPAPTPPPAPPALQETDMTPFVWKDRRTQYFWIDADLRILTSYPNTPTGQFSAPAEVPGGGRGRNLTVERFGGAAAAATALGETPMLTVVGTDGKLYTNIFEAGPWAWTGWTLRNALQAAWAQS